MSEMILEGLNPQQREAILHTDGPLLILAGAGSGKTRVITHRFAYLAKKGSPSSILTVTFTNKASNEMKARISTLIEKDLKNCWVGTFHSQCNRILRKEINVLGYGRDFSIYDEDDQCKLIRHILKEFKIYEALYKGIRAKISNFKSDCITPEMFIANSDGFGFEEKLARVYVRYQDEMKRCNALDYDDLIMIATELFEKHPEKLRKYQRIFKHVLVDEFQDTNAAQYKLLKLLTKDKGNICVVGDDDQSIYGFRGANVENILNFENDFPNTRTIKLEQNYRSTMNILNVSGSVIANNVRRMEKKIWTERKNGDKVSHCWFVTDLDEAKYVAKLLKELYLKGKHTFSDFAVLYRINLQARPLEEALRREKLPYRVLGGLSFYRRKEVKDMLAYMRLALNRNDNVSLRRIINTPSRGIGASTLAKLEQLAKKKDTSLYAAVKNVIKKNSITASVKEKLSGFVAIIEDIASTKHKDTAGMLRYIYTITAYAEGLDEQRAEHVEELITSAEGRPVKDFIDEMSLITDMDEEMPPNAITLMTIHASKGLEFPVVCLTGLEEGVLPYFKAQAPLEIAEERRLIYVGMTRAKELLYLTGAKKRRLYSKVQEQEQSRFLSCLPDECTHRVDKVNKSTGSGRKTATKGKRKKPKGAFAIGARVKHSKWGVGVVRDCYGDGEEQKISVNFPEHGVKRLALKFAQIEKI